MIRKESLTQPKGWKIYGSERVIEPPTSENALTGICLGLCEEDLAYVCTSEFDFALLSFDQIINSIAKWKFMYGKTIININGDKVNSGKGMGTGPTHSQSYHSFLASIPGLSYISI